VKSRYLFRPGLCTALSLAVAVIVGHALLGSRSTEAQAGPWHWFHPHHDDGGPPVDGVGQDWLWDRSPDLEQVVVASLYNRYCMRCHGSDGRGTWNMPRLPDFSNPHWQASRSNAFIERAIIQGRWGCMPAFREVISCQEAAALACYLRTFVPGTELSRPLIPAAKKSAAPPKR
jgi:cytochrome c553